LPADAVDVSLRSSPSASPVDKFAVCVTHQRNYPQTFNLTLARVCAGVLVSKS